MFYLPIARFWWDARSLSLNFVYHELQQMRSRMRLKKSFFLKTPLLNKFEDIFGKFFTENFKSSNNITFVVEADRADTPWDPTGGHRGSRGIPIDGPTMDYRCPSIEMNSSKTAYAPHGKKFMYLGTYASMDHRWKTKASTRSLGKHVFSKNVYFWF